MALPVAFNEPFFRSKEQAVPLVRAAQRIERRALSVNRRSGRSYSPPQMSDSATELACEGHRRWVRGKVGANAATSFMNCQIDGFVCKTRGLENSPALTVCQAQVITAEMPREPAWTLCDSQGILHVDSDECRVE